MVKKTALFGLFLLFYIASATAQTSEFGVKGGIGASTLDATFNPVLSNSQNSSFKSIISYQIGGYYRYAFSDQLGLKGELLFARKGGKTENIVNGSFYQGQEVDLVPNPISNYYLNVPIAVSWFPVKHLELETGFEYGFLLNNRSDEQFYKMGKHDAGILAGIAWHFKKTFLSVRYVYGLTTVFRNQNMTTDSQMGLPNMVTNSKNRSLQVSIGFKLFGK